ncbi:MAG TPA: sigma-70 family RNA polymerase sigma factor [Nodosilinea sp.]|nr:sigma-70 family RNA polymerase sigma factor [Nodosilinea sp.]
MPSPPPPETQPETQQFNHDVQLLLRPNNPHARSLLAFIKRTIYQFELHGHLTETDVFIDAYLRGVRYTQHTQTPIRQPQAWIRRTAYNIIRERQRDRQRYSAVAFDELLEPHAEAAAARPEFSPDEHFCDQAFGAVLAALGSLPSRDRTLIEWKFIEGLTWQEVQTRLSDQGEPPTSQAALRKRGQRALERLRQNYHSFSGETMIPAPAPDAPQHPG